MNKKIFQSALAVVTMMFGVSALAQQGTLVLTTSNTDYPRVSVGGTVVMKDQRVFLPDAVDEDGVSTSSRFLAGQKVILRLPAGTNFVGTPMASALRVNFGSTPSESTALRLADSASDSALTVPAVLEDTNEDGLPDRAEVAISDSGAPLDYVVFRGSIIVSSRPNRTDLVDDVLQGRLLVSQSERLVEDNGVDATVADASTGLALLRDPAMTATPVALDVRAPVLSLGAGTTPTRSEFGPLTHLLTIPAEYPLGQGITVTLGLGGLSFGGSTAPTMIEVVKLTDGAPDLTPPSTTGAPSTTATGAATGRFFSTDDNRASRYYHTRQSIPDPI
jgi:hypothetical protein